MSTTTWTFAERQAALKFPSGLRNYTAQKEWLAQRKSDLGFPENPLHFSHSKKGPKTFWVVIDLDALYDAECTLGPRTADVEWSAWEANRYEAALRAEGSASSVDDAWPAACAAIGTDRLELAGAMYVSGLREARHKLRQHQRLAGLQPTTQEAQVPRYVYRRIDYDHDHYQWSEDYRARRARFCYQRHQIVRETPKLLFIARQDSGAIDRDGNLDAESKVIQVEDGTHRVAKAEFEVDTSGEDFLGTPLGAALVGSGWGCWTAWLSLEQLVEHHERQQREFLRGLQVGGQHASWRTALAIPADLELTRDQLQSYYRKAARQAHPDTGGTNEAFLQVQEAYQTAQRMVAA